jgi:hypothetical protein
MRVPQWMPCPSEAPFTFTSSIRPQMVNIFDSKFSHPSNVVGKLTGRYNNPP